jgi:hypothetical protein
LRCQILKSSNPQIPNSKWCAKIAEKPVLAKKSNEIQMMGAKQCPPLIFTTFATLF